MNLQTKIISRVENVKKGRVVTLILYGNKNAHFCATLAANLAFSVRRRLAISNENFIIANEFQIVSKKSDDLAKKCNSNFFSSAKVYSTLLQFSKISI